MLSLQKQRYRHNPEAGTWGDCHRTAYAMLLNIPRDDVPHVFDNDRPLAEGLAIMKDFLRGRNLAEVALPVSGDCNPEQILEQWKRYAPGVPFILGGMSSNGTNHSVAVCEGVIYDPALDDSGIVGPCDDGYYWITFLVPLPQ